MSRGFVLPRQISPPIAAAAGALVLVLAQAVGSAVTSVAVANAFSTTYDEYVIVYGGGTGSGASSCRITFNNSAGSTYSGAYSYAAWTATAWTIIQINNGTYAICANIGVDNSWTIQVHSPFLAKATLFTTQWVDNEYWGSASGRDSNAASQTGFTLTPAPANTLTGGTIYVYGLAKA